MKRALIILGLVFLVLVLLVPGYLRAYRVLGDSDAPALVTGDRVLVSFLSYDIRLPYTTQPALRIRDPRPGDIIVFRDGNGQVVFKRVVAGPGTRISMEANHLFINGHPLDYTGAESIAIRGELGSILEIEHGAGWEVCVSFTRGAGKIDSFDELVVPVDNYFVLGSNRDLSEDSRHYGTIPRDRIIGRVIRKL